MNQFLGLLISIREREREREDREREDREIGREKGREVEKNREKR